MPNRHGGVRKNKQWSSIPGVQLNLTSAGTSGAASLPFTSPFTVMRMLGGFMVGPTNGGAFSAGDAMTLAFAIGVVSTDAVAAGAGSLPDPAGEPDFPWLYWKEATIFLQTATPAPGLGAHVERVSFDIRSMRKLKPRESLASIVQYVDISGVPPVNVQINQTRVLLAGG